MGSIKPMPSRISRRRFAWSLLGAACPARLLCNEPVSLERRYRADASILLFSVPLFHRSDVGGGSVVWKEPANTANSKVRRTLEFVGYSNPARAAGLNRLGFIQETSGSDGNGRDEVIYFGLMSSSPEESMEAARKSLKSDKKDAAFTAIDGRIVPGSVETSVATFLAPARLSVEGRDELVARARRALSGAVKKAPDFDPRRTASLPFLHSLAAAIIGGGPQTTHFTFSGRLYRLLVESAPDPEATAVFRKHGLLPTTRAAIRVSGRLRRAAGGKESRFRVWVEEGATRPIPLRIEYRPKSYLRLVFEAVVPG
jgi:hypothetical protein